MHKHWRNPAFNTEGVAPATRPPLTNDAFPCPRAEIPHEPCLLAFSLCVLYFYARILNPRGTSNSHHYGHSLSLLMAVKPERTAVDLIRIRFSKLFKRDLRSQAIYISFFREFTASVRFCSRVTIRSRLLYFYFFPLIAPTKMLCVMRVTSNRSLAICNKNLWNCC